MSSDEKRKAEHGLHTSEKVRRGFMSIPQGELEDMERERKRVARKPVPGKPETPRK